MLLLGKDTSSTVHDMDTVPGLGVHGASIVWYSRFRLSKQHIAWRMYIDLHMSKIILQSVINILFIIFSVNTAPYPIAPYVTLTFCLLHQYFI